jgi:rhodanese-related sulfurtransferase
MAPLDADDAGVNELANVVGKQGLLDVEQDDELALADGFIAAAQHVEDLDSDRLSQCLGQGREALGGERGVKARGGSAALNGSGSGGNREGGHINLYCWEVRWTVARAHPRIKVFCCDAGRPSYAYDPHMPRRTVNELLTAARARLHRLDPAASREAQQAGATLIDIRSESQIAADGVIPGALVIARNVLEWRLDPSSGASHPDAPTFEDQVIVVCNEGYQSSLVAATLQEMGFTRATDLDGGFQAWRAAGLPCVPPPDASP